MKRPEPLPALYASIRESRPGEIADFNRELWSQFQTEKVAHRRLTYADYIYENAATDDAAKFAWWRGLLRKDDGALHAGSTEDDRLLYAAMLDAASEHIEQEDHGFSAALTCSPTRPSGEVGISPRSTPAFFTVEHSPARVDARELDAGVALLVKTLPLVGVWSWSSCDGHHFLGTRPRDTVASVRIALASLWDALWLAGLLSLARRHIHLACDWQLKDDRFPNLVVRAPKSVVGDFPRAFTQDRDLQALGRFFLREDVNEAVRSAKRHCRNANQRRRIGRFHEALQQIDSMTIDRLPEQSSLVTN